MTELTPEAIVADLKKLKVTEGPLVGEPFVVMPWQHEIVEAVCGYRDIAFSISRGGGKTAFVAAVATSAIRPDGALFRPRGQVLIISASLSQGGNCFDHVVHYMRDILYRGDGRKNPEWSIQDSTQRRAIKHVPSGTRLVLLGADPRRLHGYAPHFVIADEPAQWAEASAELAYNALTTGLGKQSDPKFFAIGTQSDRPTHWFQKLLNSDSPSVWAKTYAAERGDDDFDVETWRKANPSIDHIPTLRPDIEINMQKVKDGAMTIHAFRALHLNTGTPEHEAMQPLVEVDRWEKIVSEDAAQRGGPVAIGVDLGGGTSMSAVSFYWPDTGRLECYGAFPQKPNLVERGKKDGVDDLYVKMHERGEVVLLGDFATDNVAFLKMFLPEVAEYERIGGIVADNYAKTKMQQALHELGMDPERDIDERRVGRGANGKEDIEAFQAEVLTGYMSVEPNLTLEHAIRKAVVDRDRNGNPALFKADQRGRIDVLQAAVLSVGQGYRWRRPIEAPPAFDSSYFAFGAGVAA